MNLTNYLIKGLKSIAVAVMLAVPATMMVSCEEDAPEFSHNAMQLEDSWAWQTTEGDAAEYFQVEVKRVSDDEIKIVNFHNLDGEEMLVKISGTNLSFSGKYPDYGIEVKNGEGVITNGWLTMTITYELESDGETEKFAATLDKKKVMSKKAVAKM